MTDQLRVVEPLSPGKGGDARSAARGGLSLLLAQTAARFVALAFVIAATRAFAPAAFGRYSVATAIVLFGGIIGDLGTTTAITRTISADPATADRLLAGTVLPCAGLGVIAWGACVAFTVAARYPTLTLVDVTIAGGALPVTSALTSMLGALDGAGAIARRSALTLTQTTVSLLTGLALVAAGFGPRPLIASTLTGPVVTAVAAVVVTRRLGLWRSPPCVNATATWWLVRRSAPYALLAGIAIIYRRLDVVVLSLLRDRAQVANYDLALRVIEGLGYFGSAISAPALFLFSRRLASGDIDGAQRALRTAARAVYLVGFLIASMLFCASQPLVRAVFGAPYAGAGIPLAVLGAGIWLDFVGVLQGAVLAAGARLRQGILLGLGLVIGLGCMDVALIAVWGATGAAIAMVAFEIASVVGIALFNRRVNGVQMPPPPARVIAAAVVCGVAIRLAIPFAGVAAVIVGAAVYVATLVLTRAVGLDDLAMIRRVVGGRSPA